MVGLNAVVRMHTRPVSPLDCLVTVAVRGECRLPGPSTEPVPFSVLAHVC